MFCAPRCPTVIKSNSSLNFIFCSIMERLNTLLDVFIRLFRLCELESCWSKWAFLKDQNDKSRINGRYIVFHKMGQYHPRNPTGFLRMKFSLLADNSDPTGSRTGNSDGGSLSSSAVA